MRFGDLAPAQLEFFLGQGDDTAAFGRFIRERGQLRGVGQDLQFDPRRRYELSRHAIAQRDRAGLVQQEHIDVTGGFDGPAGSRQDVASHQTVDPRNADRAQQSANRRGNQTDDQRQQHRQGSEHHATLTRRLFVVDGHRREHEHHDDEERRQTDEDDVERDLVRCELTPRALDHQDHPVEE